MQPKQSFRSMYYGSKERQINENPRLFPPPSPDGPIRLPPPGIGMGGLGSKRKSTYPLYRSADALEYAVSAYFTLKEEQGKPPTMAGMALALGFRSSRSFREYEEQGEEYADIIESARTKMEEWKNEALLEGKCPTSGVIFDLKNNHQWKERVENNTTVDSSDTLLGLLNTLQGTVLRPELPSQEDYTAPEPIEEAEFYHAYEEEDEPTDDDDYDDII